MQIQIPCNVRLAVRSRIAQIAVIWTIGLLIGTLYTAGLDPSIFPLMHRLYSVPVSGNKHRTERLLYRMPCCKKMFGSSCSKMYNCGTAERRYSSRYIRMCCSFHSWQWRKCRSNRPYSVSGHRMGRTGISAAVCRPACSHHPEV